MEGTESKPAEKKPDTPAAAQPAKAASTGKPAAAAPKAPQPRTSVPPGPKTESSHTKQTDAQPPTDRQEPDANQAQKPDPDFRSLTDLSELIDCYNEMTLTATDLGLKTIPVKTFPSVQTGVQACERLHTQIKSTREGKKDTKKMAKSTKSKANGTGGRTRTKLPPDAKVHATRISTAQARKLWFDKSISSVEAAAERAGPGWSRGTMYRTFGARQK